MDRGHPPLTACGGRGPITVINYARCDRLQDFEKGTPEALRPSPPDVAANFYPAGTRWFAMPLS
jgi:hypothetical protein